MAAGAALFVEPSRRSAWAWWELPGVDERVGGAPRARVDALRLLVAFIPHTDNKGEQQRLMCLPEGGERRRAPGALGERKLRPAYRS